MLFPRPNSRWTGAFFPRAAARTVGTAGARKNGACPLFRCPDPGASSKVNATKQAFLNHSLNVTATATNRGASSSSSALPPPPPPLDAYSQIVTAAVARAGPEPRPLLRPRPRPRRRPPLRDGALPAPAPGGRRGRLPGHAAALLPRLPPPRLRRRPPPLPVQPAVALRLPHGPRRRLPGAPAPLRVPRLSARGGAVTASRRRTSGPGWCL